MILQALSGIAVLSYVVFLFMAEEEIKYCSFECSAAYAHQRQANKHILKYNEDKVVCKTNFTAVFENGRQCGGTWGLNSTCAPVKILKRVLNNLGQIKIDNISETDRMEALRLTGIIEIKLIEIKEN